MTSPAVPIATGRFGLERPPMRPTGVHAVGTAAPAVEMTESFLITGDAPSSFAGAGFAGAVRS